jgi:hypothetical protein
MSRPRNYYDMVKKTAVHNPKYNDHLLEVPFRMIVVAASGGGKSNFLCELIHATSGTFEEIIICTRCKDEPLYNMLEKKLKGGVRFYESQIPPIDEFKGDKAQRLICFDDLILSRSLQANIGEYFIRSRKYNISCVYLSQSYFAIPKIVRLQAGYIVIKKIPSMKDLKLIVREYSLGLSMDQLMDLYKSIVATGTLEFLMIDTINPKYKYRRNFTPLEIEEDDSV